MKKKREAKEKIATINKIGVLLRFISIFRFGGKILGFVLLYDAYQEKI
jgi:hypothetical protein